MTEGEVLDLPVAVLTSLQPLDLLGLAVDAAGLYRRAVEAEFVCSTSHDVLTRLSRWVLSLCEAEPTGVAIINQVELAQLGHWQRTSVCTAVARLRARNAIKVARGRIVLLDRAALSEIGCDCGQPVRRSSGSQTHGSSVRTDDL